MGSKNVEKKQKKRNRSKLSESSDPSPLSARNTNYHEGGNKRIITDSRFSSVHSDPRFQNVPKHKAKVAIDSRFHRMFSDKSFSSSSAPLDKRGKPRKHNSENSLRHYYRIEGEKQKDVEEGDSEEEEEEESEEIGGNSGEEDENVNFPKADTSSELEASDSEENVAESDESEYATDTDEGDYEEEVYEDEVPEVAAENIPEIDKETRRLAVVNMDWRYVKAVDLYVMLSSFLPKDGQILSVAVYPSEFGLLRMKEEEVHGPVGLFDHEQEKSSEDNEEIDNEEIANEKLRAYERSRLKYYYAAVECDSIATADYLYKTCDGVEFERSSNVLDLRFIPDSMKFEHPPRDIATEVPGNYEVLDFHTSALQHSKINISWDEDEPQRVKALKRKFNADQLAELEFKEFLASEESESDDDNENTSEGQSDKKNRKGDLYRALLQSGNGSDEDGEEDAQDMEVTFNTGLEDISKRILEKKDKNSETVWEAYLRKRREKKKGRKNKTSNSSEDESSDTDQEAVEQEDDFFVEEPSAKRSKKDTKKDEQRVDMDREAEASRAELELLLADDQGADNGIRGYNLKRNKAKGKKVKELVDEDKIPNVDYNDPRFSALFSSHLFALDPTDPQFKRSAAYARQVALKQHKGEKQKLTESQHLKLPTRVQSSSDDLQTDDPVKSDLSLSKKEKHELSSLVRSIKMKSKQVQLPSNVKISKKDEREQSRGMEEKQRHKVPAKTKSVRKKNKGEKK